MVPLLVLLVVMLVAPRVALRVAWSLLLPERFMEVCQLVIELAPSLGDLVEACTTLSIRGSVARCFLAIR
jgi:hypothetical protein